MRASQLFEGVDLHPSRMTQGNDGPLIGGPSEFERRVEKPCRWCKGTGRDAYAAEFDIDEECEACNGSKTEKVWEYDYPTMRFTVMHMELMRDILGFEGDGWTGWIPPEDVPVYIRRMIAFKNGDTSQFTSEPTDERGPTRVDRSGDIPTITSGPRMIGGGVDQSRVDTMIDSIMEIFVWAKKHNCGVSWA